MVFQALVEGHKLLEVDNRYDRVSYWSNGIVVKMVSYMGGLIRMSLYQNILSEQQDSSQVGGILGGLIRLSLWSMNKYSWAILSYLGD